MTRSEAALSGEQMEVISALMRQMMAPVMEQIGGILQRDAEAMERIAATQQITNARISDLEKQVRLKTPLSRAQEKHLNEAIRARARALLDSKGYGDDRKAVTKLAGAIRKSVLARYGVDSLREAPAYDYDVAMAQARDWNDLLAVRDAAREAKKRAEESAEKKGEAENG